MSKRVYVLDGNEFSTWDEFARTFSDVVLVDWQWNENLNAFNDILRGGFGTPEEGFVLRWLHSDVSRQKLNDQVGDQTLFEVLVEIIRDHGPGGAQALDGVELELL